jgi:hypothetical protein
VDRCILRGGSRSGGGAREAAGGYRAPKGLRFRESGLSVQGLALSVNLVGLLMASVYNLAGYRV